MPPQKLFFRDIKEDRGWYFVEYKPPIPSFRFATLNVVVPEPARAERIAAAMETELTRWLDRYPIPLMVSAFDGTGDLCDLTGVRSCNHLIGFRNEEAETLLYWRLVKDQELPADALDNEHLRKIYSEFPCKTSEEAAADAARYAMQLRRGWGIVFAWAVIVPAIVATLEWRSPPYVAALVWGYSMWKAIVKALKMLGKWKKSQGELRKEEEERRMRHHHYHCERNPEGFLRLKAENFEREEREEIKREAMSLKQSKSR